MGVDVVKVMKRVLFVFASKHMGAFVSCGNA